MVAAPDVQPASVRRRAFVRAGRLVAAIGVLAMALPLMTSAADESPVPSPTPTAKPVPLGKTSRPVRIWVPSAGIDLPVISSDRNLPGNPRGYPLCDVAQYWTRFGLPGKPGTTWIIGHAQPGMFLPLYTITAEQGPDALVGKLVKLQLRDRRLLTYRITEVRPRASYTDVSIARRPNQKQQRLILQTSTGIGTDPKLQVAATLIRAEWTDEPRPDPQPRVCWQPTPKPTPKGQKPDPTATPPPTVTEANGESISPVVLLIGSGAVLLGATGFAIWIVRRP